MPDALTTFSTRATPQSRPAGGATVKNAAGGYTFGVDDLNRVRRFLVLGSEGTYYTKAPELTRDNAEAVIRLAHSDPAALVEAITEISVAGRAPRQNPAIFALAIAASQADEAGRAYALAALPKVCRTSTHLYLFAQYVQQFRGWGRGLKRAVGAWYGDKPVDKLTYQILKYRQREGWRHADLLAKSHTNPREPVRDNLYRYIVDTMTDRDAERLQSITRTHRQRADGVEVRVPNSKDKQTLAASHYQTWTNPMLGANELPDLVGAYEQVQHATAKQAVNLIVRFDLSWEMLPDRLLNEIDVWDALIAKGMPQTALIKQLPRLTKLGLTTSKVGAVIAAQIKDREQLKRGRVHPINVLVAQRTYAAGQSVRGESTWTPTPRITDALDQAFYEAYGAVEPAGVPMLLACDVSGSMGAAASGLPITCREAVAALTLVTLNVEDGAEIIGFSDGRSHDRHVRPGFSYGYPAMTQAGVATRLDISPRRRLDDVTTYMAGLNFGRTDCALPMIWAQKNRLDFSAIHIYTDCETWFGSVHPWQALDAYRQQVGHDVRLAVVAMTATGNTIANIEDPSQIDIAGFDSSVPAVLSEFSAGRI